MALITTEEVVNLGNINDASAEAVIDLLIPGVQARAERHCMRKFDLATYTETHDAHEGQRLFYVKNPPLVAITTLTHNEPLSPQVINQTNNVRQEADYLQRGEVRLHNGEGVYYAGPGSIKIIYTGGWSTSTCPGDLKVALIQQVLYELNHSERIGLQGLRGDGAAAEYDERDGFAAQVADVLDSYRLVRKDFGP